MNEILTLIAEAVSVNACGDQITERTEREVFVCRKSVGASYKLQALAVGLKPKYRFVLADYLDYHGEERAQYQGKEYRIIDTYRGQGNALELTVEEST